MRASFPQLLLLAFYCLCTCAKAQNLPIAVPDQEEGNFQHNVSDAAWEQYQRGENENALAILRKAIRDNPDDGILNYRLSIVLMATEHVDEAMERIQKAVQLEPKNAEYHHILALVLAKKHRLDECIKELELAIRLAPDNPNMYTELGVFYLNCKQSEKAIEQLSKSIALKDSRHARMARAMARRRSGDFAGAVGDCDVLLIKDPRDQPATATRAFANLSWFNVKWNFRFGALAS